MELLNIDDIAHKLRISFFTTQKHVQQGRIPGRKLGGTWITTDRELKNYIDGKEVHEIKLVQLFDVKSAAKYLQVDVPALRRMIRDNKLKCATIDHRGSGVGTQVFTLRQVKTALKYTPDFIDTPSGRPIKDHIDDYIYTTSRSNGQSYHAIRGTYNKHYENYAYIYLHQARTRARQAHMADPVYRKGDLVNIYLEHWPEGDRLHEAFIVDNVTPICRTAKVQIFHPSRKLDGEEMMVPVPEGIVSRVAPSDL